MMWKTGTDARALRGLVAAASLGLACLAALPAAAGSEANSGPAALDTGYAHACALLTTGAARCWGWNVYGQLGDGTTASKSAPVGVSGLARNNIEIATGGFHSCALLDTGRVRCWGYNLYGQIGDGSTTNRTVSTPVSGLTNATRIAAGENHSCAVTSAGTVFCWGRNRLGQLGDATTTDRTRPVQVRGISTAVGISAGDNHTCALLADSTVRCWGNNSDGQLGIGTTGGTRTTPAVVTGLTDIVALALGDLHSCALRRTDGVRCWGRNSFGQLGDDTTTTRNRPVAVKRLPAALAVGAGAGHSCAVVPGGGGRCWGANDQGQLGDGTTTSAKLPRTVRRVTDATDIAGGYEFTCALEAPVDRPGRIRCWGRGSNGQLGNGGTADSLLPVLVRGSGYGPPSL